MRILLSRIALLLHDCLNKLRLRGSEGRRRAQIPSSVSSCVVRRMFHVAGLKTAFKLGLGARDLGFKRYVRRAPLHVSLATFIML
jgi:hypothetical protein